MDNMKEFWLWDPLLSQCQFNNGQHEIILAFGIHYCPNVSFILDNMKEFWHWDSLLSQCQFNNGQHEIILALGSIIVPMSVLYWTTWYIFGIGIHYCPNIWRISDTRVPRLSRGPNIVPITTGCLGRTTIVYPPQQIHPSKCDQLPS